MGEQWSGHTTPQGDCSSKTLCGGCALGDSCHSSCYPASLIQTCITLEQQSMRMSQALYTVGASIP